MKLPRDLAGVDLADCLCRRWNYRTVHQEGSHIIVETSEPSPQRIAIPAHSSLRVGTLNSILRAVCRHRSVTRQQILDTL